MGKHYPIKLQTMEKVIMEQQDTIVVSAEQKVLSRFIAAVNMIENGYNWNNREMLHRGLGKLVDILLPAKMDNLDCALLANRRELFIQQIDEARGDGNE